MLCTNALLANNVLPRTLLAWRLQDALVRLAMSVLKTNEEHMANRSYHSAVRGRESRDQDRLTGIGKLSVAGSLTMILPCDFGDK